MKIALKDFVTYAGMGGASAVLAGLGIVRIADAKMLADHPYFAAIIMSPWWFFVPALLLVLTTGSKFLRRPVKTETVVDTAELILEFYDNGSPPAALKYFNAWRWCFYPFGQSVREQQTGNVVAEQHVGVLVLSFDPLVMVSTLRVESKTTIPIWEVKEFNPRFAVIAFLGKMPPCTITVHVRPAPVFKPS
jgi:hypothetical protein